MSSQLKITFVAGRTGEWPSGGIRVICQYANHLSRRGHDVTVVAPGRLSIDPTPVNHMMNAARFAQKKLTGHYRPDEWLKMEPGVRFTCVPSLAERFVPDADVVIATAWQTAEWVSRYSSSKGRGFYLIQHLETWNGPEKRVYATWKAPLQKIVVSRWLAEIAAGLDETAIYIPNGLDMELFRITTPSEDRAPKRLIMLYHRAEWKGCHDGLQALSLVREREPGIRATLFGVPARPRVLPDWIDYYQSPPPHLLRELYNQAAIFVAPSRTEGWGLTACEALLCGAALVATDIDGHREFAFHGQTALTSPAMSESLLAENILRLIRDNELRVSLAKRGCEFVRQFSWDRATDAFETELRVRREDPRGAERAAGNGRSCAIVVTFHPSPQHLQNLTGIRAQVDQLIVVDNGSTGNELAQIRLNCEQLRSKLIENGENLGIAAALNLGVRRAQQEGCRWVALFDQDSSVTEGFISTLIAEFQLYSRERKILQIVPRYRDLETGNERPVSHAEDGGAFLTITSGSLFVVEAFEECGLFQENLFVYCVDDDYSLRIRQKGFFIGLSRSAVLLHQSGHPTSRKLFGRTLTTKNYRPEVRYYYARNKVWILRKYGLSFPRLIVPTLREFLTTPVKIALMEEASWEKIKFFTRGLVDGVAGKMGPLRTT
jgi:GT2 family glycosyltransferase/glycosyltransferase involved in cell wall biosynthesis